MITGLFMGWTDIHTKEWFPVRKMTWIDREYHTVYLHGILAATKISETQRAMVKSGLIKLDRIEISDDIELSFKRRMPVHRPFTDLEKLERLSLPRGLNKFDPFEYVARTGGRMATDNYDIFPESTPDEFGIYQFYFTAGAFDGVDITEYVARLQVGEGLSIENGSVYHQNFLLDKVPGYINNIAKHHPQSIQVTVAKISYDRYGYGSLLCTVKVNGNAYIHFSDSHYQPLVNILTEAC
jgi:hypothetical protein